MGAFIRLTEQEYEKLMAGRQIKPQKRLNTQSNTNIATMETEAVKTPDIKPKGKQKQTKAEMEYGHRLSLEFPGVPVIPWGLTIRMQNGHVYTPDFIVLLPKILIVEVKQRGKNGFRQLSYQRAKLAYDQCKVEFTQFDYRWAEKHCGIWNI